MTKTKWYAIFFMALVCLLFGAMTATAANDASSAKKDARGEEISARYKNLECRVNLGLAQADIIDKYTNISGIDTKIAKVRSDLVTMKGYADSGNTTLFNDFMKNTVKADVDDLQRSIQEFYKGFKSQNLTNETRTALKADWKDAISDFADCNGEARRDVVSAREKFMDEQINEWNQVKENFRVRGFDVRDMDSIDADAERLNELLGQALNSTSDADFKAKIEEARQLHLHLWARFQIAKLDSYLTKLEPLADKANMTVQVTEIRALLTEATELALPEKAYSEGDFKATWEKIKLASEKLNDLAKNLRDDAKGQRQEKNQQLKDQRQENRDLLKNMTDAAKEQLREAKNGLDNLTQEQRQQGREQFKNMSDAAKEQWQKAKEMLKNQTEEQRQEWQKEREELKMPRAIGPIKGRD
jgi:hypothetical protein